MDDATFNQITGGLFWAMRRYPNCTIANCDCNSKNGERIGECYCLCHIDEFTKKEEDKE